MAWVAQVLDKSPQILEPRGPSNSVQWQSWPIPSIADPTHAPNRHPHTTNRLRCRPRQTFLFQLCASAAAATEWCKYLMVVQGRARKTSGASSPAPCDRFSAFCQSSFQLESDAAGMNLISILIWQLNMETRNPCWGGINRANTVSTQWGWGGGGRDEHGAADTTVPPKGTHRKLQDRGQT